MSFVLRIFFIISNHLFFKYLKSSELKENPPAIPQFDKLTRNILATNPRVTRFKIDWETSKFTFADDQMNDVQINDNINNQLGDFENSVGSLSLSNANDKMEL